ncbi:MAG: C10 family peptidase [Bacteroidales bacterium]|nr:C10 family peptidase [Bacteroidales bacterium]
MKKILILSVMLVSLGAWGSELSPNEALKRAHLANNPALKNRVQQDSQLRLVSTFEAEGTPTVYAFADGHTTVLLSADDRVAPVLGYFDQPTDMATVPANVAKWLEEYSRQITWARANRSGDFVSITRPERDPISPLLTTQWSQRDPYNRLCPIDYTGERSVTGCVATAMAQVMNYHQWPAQGKGVINYTWGRWDGSSEDLSLDLSTITFDWDNMIATYQNDDFTDAQAQAVAELMQACGYSVNMIYSSQTSGTSSQSVPVALVQNFDYSNSAQIEVRDLYTLEQWEEMVYNNLKNYGPVLYSGITTYWEGHEFVVDGYQADGYFHLNWGWNGLCDGYFLLDALTPEVMGTGGAESGQGFIYYQDAVMNLAPSTASGTTPSDPYLYTSTPLYAWLYEGYDNVIELGNDIYSAGNRDENYDLGFRLTSGDSSSQVVIVENDLALPMGYYLYGVWMSFDDVAPGSYSLVPVYRINGNTEWLNLRLPVSSDPDILVDYDGEKVTLHVGELTYGQLQVPALSQGATAEVTLTATSTYRVDQESALALLLASGEDGNHTTLVQTLFEIINIPAGGSGTWKWQLEIPEDIQPGEYSLWLYEPTGTPFHGADVTITQGAGVQAVSVDVDTTNVQLYDLNGRPATSRSRGILISGRQKLLLPNH